MTEACVTLTYDGAVACVRLENERKLNALTPEMLNDLIRICDEVEARPDIRAVILTGAGERAFCCGADINAWADLPPFDFARTWVRAGHRVFDRLARLSLPVIAAINAHAFGGGLELVCACDLRVMRPSAQLALPESGVGIVPGWSGTQRLARQIPPALLKSMAFLGRRLDATQALSIGFINALSDDPLKSAREIAEEISCQAPRSVEVSKAMIGAALGEDRAAVIESLGGGLIATSGDKQIGVQAFRNKQKPKFGGV